MVWRNRQATVYLHKNNKYNEYIIVSFEVVNFTYTNCQGRPCDPGGFTIRLNFPINLFGASSNQDTGFAFPLEDLKRE